MTRVLATFNWFSGFLLSWGEPLRPVCPWIQTFCSCISAALCFEAAVGASILELIVFVVTVSFSLTLLVPSVGSKPRELEVLLRLTIESTLWGEPLRADYPWIQFFWSLISASRDFDAAVGAMTLALVVTMVFVTVEDWTSPLLLSYISAFLKAAMLGLFLLRLASNVGVSILPG